jgi:FkbM family methyltransferase
MKRLAKTLLRRTPYRVVRAGALNRFDAIEETLFALRRRGFRPTRVVDGGANVGAFARRVRMAFPAAEIELIEPQPACHESMSCMTAEPGCTFHSVALVGPSHLGGSIALSVSPGEITTGAHVCTQPNENTVDVPARTLDAVLRDRVGAHERIFVKLDLQGYELEALAGSEQTLLLTEVILIEVSFFAQAYEPPISKLVAYLDARGFVLYDIAALSERARDGRARQGDFLFVRSSSPLLADSSWS